jgi:hypothetical protein
MQLSPNPTNTSKTKRIGVDKNGEWLIDLNFPPKQLCVKVFF